MAAQDEVKTQPDKRFSFNVSTRKDQVYAIRLTDDGPKPVMWTIQSTAPDRIKFSAENGYLPPTESTNVTVTLNPFEFKDGLNDRFNIEWINVPDDDDGPKPVMWTIQSTAPDRIKFSAENGYLPPTESTNVTVTLNPFEFKDGLNDRFNIEWINVPDDGPKAFDMEYMQKCDVIKKKVITIHYNI
ncbi:hypothetical protein M513_05757 [Trichuris suis]|uniref:Major sperm protein n=1 Tax=Trichuris suis TaxID=68888 RepID=A0A085M7T0_9BILA|nr:hypothetical protein M513_05757 [Trichuris suis]